MMITLIIFIFYTPALLGWVAPDHRSILKDIEKLKELYTPQSQHIAGQIAALQHTIITSVPEHNTTESNNEQVELTELEWLTLKSVTTVLTPLMTTYTMTKLVPEHAYENTFEDQLDQINQISTFVKKLKNKLEQLPTEHRDFIRNSPHFRNHPIGKSVIKVLIVLQSFLEIQISRYQAVKPQTSLVKDLKKLANSCKKEVDDLAKQFE